MRLHGAAPRPDDGGEENLVQNEPMTGVPAANRPTCPECGAAVDRIARRWLDRLLSLFTPVRRYRCRSMACGWEGQLRNRRFSLPASDREKRYDRRIDAP